MNNVSHNTFLSGCERSSDAVNQRGIVGRSKRSKQSDGPTAGFRGMGVRRRVAKKPFIECQLASGDGRKPVSCSGAGVGRKVVTMGGSDKSLLDCGFRVLKNDPQQALSYAESVLRRERGLSAGVERNAVFLKARAYFNQGRFSECRQFLSSLPSWAREDKNINLCFGKVLQELGMQESAREVLEYLFYCESQTGRDKLKHGLSLGHLYRDKGDLNSESLLYQWLCQESCGEDNALLIRAMAKNAELLAQCSGEKVAVA